MTALLDPGSMMSPAPPLVGDASRLAALASYDILDTLPEPGFDDIVHLACRACSAPVALVSLVAGDRQWFKARVGFPACETDLNSSVCAHALARPDEVLVIPDLANDPRTVANPLVTGEPFISFYAGAPLVTPDRQVLGSLCVLDHNPRPEGLTDAQSDDLKALARQVVSQLELRRAIASRDAARREERQEFQAREALGAAQAAMVDADGDLDTILRAIVRGAMRTVPEADGGVVGLIDGVDLEYRATRGTLTEHLGLRLPLAGSFAGHCASSGVPQMMDDAATDPHVRRDLVERLRLCSAIATPVLRGGSVLGVLKLQSSQPHAFDERALELIGLFAGLATAGLAAAEGRALIHAKDVYWRGLFHRLSEGFVVGEVVRDSAGHVVDWRYIEVNPAWGDLVGIRPTTVIGRTIREVFPGVEDEWIAEFAEVVETGRPIAFTRRVGILRRWYEGRAFVLDRDRFGVMFLEATARVEAEARRTALLELGDRLRDLDTPQEMTRIAAEIVGRAMGVTRAGFGQVDIDVEMIDIASDWTAPGMASIAGRHRFNDYGDLQAYLRRGEALVIDDVMANPRTCDDPAPLQALGVGALVDMPVRERGRTVAMFFVHDSERRVWAADELAFLRNVADRVEVGVARVRAENQQAVLNGEIAHRLKNTLAIVQAIVAQTLRRAPSVAEARKALTDRILALGKAHDALMTGSTDATTIGAVVKGALAIHASHGDRIHAAGTVVGVGPSSAMSLSLMLHELATNATKYGALSVPAGWIELAWMTEPGPEGDAFILTWTERGGPSVVPPERRGFGSQLIERGFGAGAEVALTFEPTGVMASLRAPLAAFQSGIIAR